MAKATLVDRDILEGERLLETLRKSGEKVPVALWLYESVSESWRLVLAVPQMARGAREAYGFIFNVLKGMPQPFHLGIPDIKLVSPQDPLVTNLLSEGKSLSVLTERILSPLRIGDAYLDGAYLYKAAA